MQSDQEILVPNNDEPIYSIQSVLPVKSKKFPQYLAALSSTISALAAGIVLGWTSPLEDTFKNKTFMNITINTSQFAWIGSLTTLGALLACIPTGYICDKIGRKTTLLMLLIPFCSGWLLIVFAHNVTMIYIGRFLNGVAAGACCVAVPMYNSEIADKEIRGSLGSYFQLMVTVGVLYAYVFGALLDPVAFTIACSLVPIFFGIVFVFQPETPLFYFKVGKYEKAKESMMKLRGAAYNVDAELNELENCIQETPAFTLRTLERRAVKKSVYIAFLLMFFQQFSGINAVIFYTGDIFANAGASLDPKYATIIVGVCQVVATFASSVIVDKLGRRILLIISALLMSFSVTLLALFFILKTHNHIPPDVLKTMSYLPIVLLVVYIVAFSLGFGPVPWIMLGEIFAPDVKGIACSLAGSFNWLLAFVITKLYLPVDQQIGDFGIFSFFGSMLLFAALFVYFYIPETKGKSVTEIQDELQHY